MTNLVPAVAVIRVKQVLFVVIRCKGYVDFFLVVLPIKDQRVPLKKYGKTEKIEYTKGLRNR